MTVHLTPDNSFLSCALHCHNAAVPEAAQIVSAAQIIFAACILNFAMKATSQRVQCLCYKQSIADHFSATLYGLLFCRWEHGFQAELLQHPALTAGALSLVVLDNTYCHPRYLHHLCVGLICLHADHSACQHNTYPRLRHRAPLTELVGMHLMTCVLVTTGRSFI